MATIDGAVAEAYEEIRQPTSDNDWLLVGYEGNAKLVLQAKGSGGIAACAGKLADDQCQYGCVRVSFTADDKTKRTKFVTFSWAGPASSVLRRGKMSVHKATFKAVCKDSCVDVAATGEDEEGGRSQLTEAALIERIKKVNY